jgi:hypothetical protein
MKFRVILDTENEELTVITEDGGVACIRSAEMCDTALRLATTDYYQTRMTALKDATPNNMWDLLSEGNMYAKDWADKEYNNLDLIQDALHWLCPTEKKWEMCDKIFSHFFDY